MSSDVALPPAPLPYQAPAPIAPLVHQATQIRGDGRVRAACQTDRSMRPLSRNKKYVTRPNSGAVTCPKCLESIAAKAKERAQ